MLKISGNNTHNILLPLNLSHFHFEHFLSFFEILLCQETLCKKAEEEAAAVAAKEKAEEAAAAKRKAKEEGAAAANRASEEAATAAVKKAEEEG